MAIKYAVGAEELHVIAQESVKQIRTWLDSTFRFRIDQAIYDLGAGGEPAMQLRVPQLDGRFERFDLYGQTLDEDGHARRAIFVECKDYSGAGNQGTLYDEYLAVCYSAFVKRSEELQGPADVEFMWATTHPFLVTHYTELTTKERIVTACASHAARLGGQEVDEGIAGQLAERLWLSIVNPRIDEMIPGLPVRAAVAAKLVEMHS